MKNQSNNRLPLVMLEGRTALISWNEKEKVIEDVTMYEYDSVRIAYPFTYGGLVSTIIRSRYSEDEVEAIILNGNDTDEHREEYNALQAWRAEAKTIAHNVMNNIRG